MIRMSLVVLFFIGISRANDCFDVNNNCRLGVENYNSNMLTTKVTDFHCVMQCANSLSKSTMGVALDTDNMHEKFNHQCILIDNLDFCVNLWKQKYNVDCEVPIKNMVKRTFQVSCILDSFFSKPVKN